MTFFHLVQHFGRSMHPHPLHRFLAASLSPFLRYCPICLVEHTPAYCSLLWRFLALPGCASHRVALLDQCGHCGSPLALLRPQPQLIKCPTCQADLRSSISLPLSDDALALTEQLTDDLKVLLTSEPRCLGKEQATLIGKRFQVLRQQRDLFISEVAHLLDRDASVVRDIDYLNRFRQASLDDYMCYADVLGYSLREIFDEESLQELLAPVSEEQVLDQVQVAIRQLKARGQPVLPGSIGDLVGMTRNGLEQYPRVKKLIKQCRAERRQEIFQVDHRREEELVKEIEQMLKKLEDRGEPIVLRHVCDLVGVSYPHMVRTYPRVRALFREYQKNRSRHALAPRLNEQEKVQQVQAAISLLISQGESVTFKRIRQVARLTQGQLRHSPRVKALLAQYIKRWQRETS